MHLSVGRSETIVPIARLNIFHIGGAHNGFKIDHQDKKPIPESCAQPLGSGDSSGRKKKLKPKPWRTIDIADEDSSDGSDVEIVFEKKCSSDTQGLSDLPPYSSKANELGARLTKKPHSGPARQGQVEAESSSGSSVSSSGSSVIELESDMEDENNFLQEDVDMEDSASGKSAGKNSECWDVKNNGIAKSSNMDVIVTDNEDDDGNESELPDIEEIPNVSLPSLTDKEIADRRKEQGNDYFKKGEYYKALEMYNLAINLAPTEATFFGNRAACQLMLKKFKDAAVDARKAVALDPNLQNAWLRLVRSTLALGDISGCETALASIKSNPDISLKLSDEEDKLKKLIELWRKIRSSEGVENFRDVLFYVDRARDVACGDVNLKVKRAECLLKLARFGEAQEQCTEILQSDGMVLEAVLLRASCFYYADNLDKSLQNYKQGCQLAPDNKDASNMYKRIKNLKDLREKGADRFKAQDWNAALEAYQECLTIMSSDFPVNACLGSKINFNLSMVSNKIQPQSEAAIEYVNNAVKLNPEYVKAFLHRAQLLVNQEKYEEACRDFEVALKFENHNKDIARQLQRTKELARCAKRKDYYKILGIDKKASPEEIKKAYKKRALDHHPDRHANASETVRKDQEKKFKEVLEAYEILFDDKKRRRYDLGMDANESYSPTYESFDTSQLFGQMFFQQGGMGSRGGFGQFRTGPGFSGFRH